MSLLIVFTTVGNEADARRLAEIALAKRLTACVHIDSIESLYEWQGAMVNEREWRIAFKTDAAHCTMLQSVLAEHHPYDIPAIYAVSAVHVAAPFAQWLGSTLCEKP